MCRYILNIWFNRLVKAIFILVLALIISCGSKTFAGYLEAIKDIFDKPVEFSEADRKELNEWLQENAIKFKTVQVGTGYDDLQPLKKVIGDARIVSLGEAAHMNRDFYQMKHRIVEFLVNEMGFNVIAIEGTFAGGMELNEYIQTGKGDPQRALGALSYPAWNTEEILDMVVWMREYNATHENKIKFYGFDVKPACGSAKVVYDYLQKTGAIDEYDQLLSRMMNPWIMSRLTDEFKKDPSGINVKLKNLVEHMETISPDSVSNDIKEWELAIQHARVLRQYVNFYSKSSISQATEFRDKSMAENVRWIMDYEPGAKAILWAANPHISKFPSSGTMGCCLSDIYGDDIVIIGMLRNRKFASEQEKADGANYPIDIGGRREGTLEDTLGRAGLQNALVDFRFLPEGLVSDYFNSPISGNAGINIEYPLAYDAVIFIESTLDAISLEAGNIRRFNILDKPSNLDFEIIEDGRPKGWIRQAGQSRVEYDVIPMREEPYHGELCCMIKRRPGRAFHGAFGNVGQVIDASNLSDGSLQFNAAVRVEDGKGYLWLSVEHFNGPAVFQEKMICSDEWQEYSLQIEIPQKAKKLIYGLAFVGEGAAFIDNVELKNITAK